MRKLKLKVRVKLVGMPKKVERREATREKKAEKAARLDDAIIKELVSRLHAGTYNGSGMYLPEKAYSKVLDLVGETEEVPEDEEEEEEEKEREEEGEELDQEVDDDEEGEDEDGEEDGPEFVADFGSDDEEADLEDSQSQNALSISCANDAAITQRAWMHLDSHSPRSLLLCCLLQSPQPSAAPLCTTATTRRAPTTVRVRAKVASDAARAMMTRRETSPQRPPLQEGQRRRLEEASLPRLPQRPQPRSLARGKERANLDEEPFSTSRNSNTRWSVSDKSLSRFIASLFLLPQPILLSLRCCCCRAALHFRFRLRSNSDRHHIHIATA